MNIFESAPEFVELDNRRDRLVNTVTAESMFNRLHVQLPDWFVKDNTILDLGSCLGAAGHMALSKGATHYTGIEVQEKYVNDSRGIFAKYWPSTKFNIVQENLETFLDNCISNNIKFDVVIASGVLYTFLNVISILQKISAVASKSILIDSMFVKDSPTGHGVVIIRNDVNMVYAEGSNTFTGIGGICSPLAMGIVLKTNGFYQIGETIIPPATISSHDGYSDLVSKPGKNLVLSAAPARFAIRFSRKDERTRTLLDMVLDNQAKDATEFYQNPTIVEPASTKIWKFDDSVANRFQHEALTNIPDYERVVELCLDIANDNLDKSDAIIDVGSALGYTVDKFVQAGFNNIHGLDNSEAMFKQSMHQERIILSDQFPDQPFKMIMMNWTLHFVIDKLTYIKKMYDNLEPDGYLIISDKTTQTAEVKKKYYDFKRSNGVSQTYIEEKEKKLAGYMYPVPTSWYNSAFTEVGFRSIEVINARYGFVTFLCKK